MSLIHEPAVRCDNCGDVCEHGLDDDDARAMADSKGWTVAGDRACYDLCPECTNGCESCPECEGAGRRVEGHGESSYCPRCEGAGFIVSVVGADCGSCDVSNIKDCKRKCPDKSSTGPEVN